MLNFVSGDFKKTRTFTALTGDKRVLSLMSAGQHNMRSVWKEMPLCRSLKQSM
jgi:hypothetical protein